MRVFEKNWTTEEGPEENQTIMHWAWVRVWDHEQQLWRGITEEEHAQLPTLEPVVLNKPRFDKLTFPSPLLPSNTVARKKFPGNSHDRRKARRAEVRSYKAIDAMSVAMLDNMARHMSLHDLINVQPLDGPSGTVFYTNFVADR